MRETLSILLFCTFSGFFTTVVIANPGDKSSSMLLTSVGKPVLLIPCNATGSIRDAQSMGMEGDLFSEISDQDDKPSVYSRRFVGSFFAGVAGSWCTGVPMYLIIDNNADDRRVKGDAGYSPTANAALIACSIIGNSLCVYTIGSIGNVQGSYKSTLLGCTIATLPLLFGLDDPYLPGYALTFGAVVQCLGSIAGFHRSCYFEARNVSTGFINIDSKGLVLAVPAPYITVHGTEHNESSHCFDIVLMRF